MAETAMIRFEIELKNFTIQKRLSIDELINTKPIRTDRYNSKPQDFLTDLEKRGYRVHGRGCSG